MNTLDSPIEALALNYLNLAFPTTVNNIIWPCLAVITTAAAISFWKIKAATTTAAVATFSNPEKSKHPIDRRINDPRSIDSTNIPASAVNLVLEGEGCGEEGKRKRRRGKFTVYYESEGEERETREEERERMEEEKEEEEREESCCWSEDWKRGLRMRIGEDESLGWYRCQDLTAFHGNVVKLWAAGDLVCGRESNKLVTAFW